MKVKHNLYKFNIYHFGYTRFDWFRNSRYEIIFISETVNNEPKTKWPTEVVASLPFGGLY